MDNSHNPKNYDGQASDVHPDVDSPVHILYVLWCTSYIFYIPIEHIMLFDHYNQSEFNIM